MAYGYAAVIIYIYIYIWTKCSSNHIKTKPGVNILEEIKEGVTGTF